MGKHRRRHKSTDSSEEVIEEHVTRPHSHHYKSEAHSDKNRFFHGVKARNQGVTQTTNVTVNVQPDDDPVTGCFKSMFKCFK